MKIEQLLHIVSHSIGILKQKPVALHDSTFAAHIPHM